MTTVLRLGTRGSELARAQAAIAADALEARGVGVEVVTIATRGDAISARHPRGGWVETDGQFTRELERALLDDRIDVAVHSFKDLPTEPVSGLVIGAVLPRADARDCLVTADGGGLGDVPWGGRVGTSSPRRAAQLAAHRNDLVAVPIRGNVPSRLERLRTGEVDALLLAAAGLDRLGVPVPERARLPLDVMLPAPAQAALALQVRTDDPAVDAIVTAVDDPPSRVAAETERRLLRRIGGGCLAPLGAYAEVTADRIRLRATLEDADGRHRRADASAPIAECAELVDTVARELAAVPTGAGR